MSRHLFSVDATEDLERLVDFLTLSQPEDAITTVDLIVDAIQILSQHPLIGRPIEQGLRELVISRGKTGYLALYQYDEATDLLVVLAIRHQRERGYH
ncbi:addiction module toxin RelE [Limnohabitans sp. TS-CS-82]|uniref:type II toxin-antitoxin system RelE/ParE family toxin n=1 Tax=Limnohabitans sp. TS-CS-82 TaxID=2094193 RepID=UPI000CF1FDA2|nr:type II toxin-antitoxin system RelE/ParE family toxin [Limnohabitans sp. TS-CS-82]PQA82883.1 addiction module toxin RelE [Limnohabitans sp. TS-CS-82]